MALTYYHSLAYKGIIELEHKKKEKNSMEIGKRFTQVFK